MSAAAVARGMFSKCGSERDVRCLSRSDHQLFASVFWGLSDTEEGCCCMLLFYIPGKQLGSCRDGQLT